MKTSNITKWFTRVGPIGLLIRIFLIWFICTFIIYPNVNIIASIFYINGEFSLINVTKLLSSQRAMKSLWNSFILAVSLSITVNIVGILLVVFTEYIQIKGAKILRLGYMTTLIYGGIVLCTGYKYMYGANGLVTKALLVFMPNLNPEWFTGYFAVLYIMTFACTSNHIIFVSNSIRGIDYQTIEAAKNMGASFSKILFKVVLPVLKPTLFAVTILTFLTGLSAMSAPLVIGGENFQTINPMILTFSKTVSSRSIAALLAVLLGIITIILLVFMNWVEKKGTYMSVSKVKSKIQKQKIKNPIFNFIAHLVAYLLFLIYTIPILLVVVYSFTDSNTILSGDFSLAKMNIANYTKLFTSLDSFRPYLVSIVYCSLSALLVAILVIVVVQIVRKSNNRLSTLLEYSMLIPWLLPATLIGMGLLVSFNDRVPLVGNVVLVGTPFILLIAYIIVKIPFSFRMIKATFFSVETALEEASKSMGASGFYTFRRVVFPIILPAVLSVMVLNFNSLLADYDLTVFLFTPYYKPLGQVIRSATDQSSTTNAIAMTFVYAVVLMFISAFALYFTSARDKKN